MNDAPNFASILDEAPTEISRPKPLPVGTYLCVVQGQPVYDKSNKKGTPFVEFLLRVIAAMDDVDPDDLQFILQQYFPEQSFQPKDITSYEYYVQCNIIADFFGYRVGLTFGYEKDLKRQGHQE